MRGVTMEPGMLVFGVEQTDDGFAWRLTMGRQRAPHEDGPRDVRLFSRFSSIDEADVYNLAADLQRMLRQVVPEVQTRVMSPPKPKQPQPLPLPTGEVVADAEA